MLIIAFTQGHCLRGGRRIFFELSIALTRAATGAAWETIAVQVRPRWGAGLFAGRHSRQGHSRAGHGCADAAGRAGAGDQGVRVCLIDRGGR